VSPSALADERSLAALDFAAIRARLARHAATDRAHERALALVPSGDLELVRLEQAATGEMRAIAFDAAFTLPRVVETRDAVARAARGATLPPEALRAIAIALAAAEAAVRRIDAADAPVLHARCAGAMPLGGLARRIDDAVGEQGEVLDRASPALARIRRGVAHAIEEARARCQSLLRSSQFSKAIQDSVVTVREGRFVIPVKAEFSGAIPGVVHDTSSSGQTLFVEPLAALESNNRLRTLRLEEEREVARVLAELSAAVGAQAAGVEANCEALAEIDLVLSRARLAEEMRAVAPSIVDDPRLEIYLGRHPLLGERAVPQSFTLGAEERIIVISGPNMGGKTVTLKLAGLLVLMAACGMHLPCGEGTTVGGFTRVACGIGDEQSIAENASTFSAHVERLRTILDGADERTLILIDEIASGTEPAAGAALGVAILEYLLAAGSRAIVTTHATELKLFAHSTAGVVNAGARFDARTYAPTYELDIGSPGQSLAFPLARALGLAPAIVDRAEALLSENERDYDKALAELAEIRGQAAAERDALARERAHLAALQDTARRRAEALERERRTFAQAADERLGRALREFTAELDRRARESAAERTRVRVTQGQTSLLGRVLDDVHRDLGVAARPERAAETAQIGVGDTVAIESFGSEGQVVADYGETALVAIGSMKTVVSKADLRLRRRPDAGRPGRVRRGATTLESASNASIELDVRGKRYVEAEPLVERWIDEAKLLGLSPLRLIHGKGTGLLGRGLQEYLKSADGVRAVRYGNADEGGSGVTVFELA
jgi:DNA mismatch repair protein MutS2